MGLNPIVTLQRITNESSTKGGAMSEIQQPLDQWLPVPGKVWSALKVSPVDRMSKFWAELTPDIRHQWMTWAKCREYQATPAWTQLDEQDRISILRVMGKVRAIYVGSNLTENWRHVAAMGR